MKKTTLIFLIVFLIFVIYLINKPKEFTEWVKKNVSILKQQWRNNLLPFLRKIGNKVDKVSKKILSRIDNNYKKFKHQTEKSLKTNIGEVEKRFNQYLQALKNFFQKNFSPEKEKGVKQVVDNLA